MTATLTYESGSYRDRDGRVFYDQSGGICRGLSARAKSDWDFVRRTAFFQREMQAGRIVKTREDPTGNGSPSLDGWEGILRHEAVPFVSYPFEWTFGMLRDAALLHLELLAAALDEDVTLKDGTAYNVQWSGAHPVFIDVASFERLEPGRPWAGYRQFCQTFLYPLLLQAYRDIPFQPWLRGRLEGITPRECRNLMSLRDLFRRGVASHVVLHSWLESRRGLEKVDSMRVLPAAGFNKELIRNNITGLLRVIERLRWTPQQSTWSDYADSNSYTPSEKHRKESFVREAVHSRRWRMCWDLGCNTGTYSRIAAENVESVVALDADHLSVERFYQALKQGPAGDAARILPLVTSIVDVAGGLGWRGRERKSLVERGRPELVVCLALLHHLTIGAGVPLRDLMDWLAELGASLVIEFVTREDAMVRRLLHNRRDNYADYDLALFERLLSERFDIIRTEMLESGTRRLYYAAAR